MYQIFPVIEKQENKVKPTNKIEYVIVQNIIQTTEKIGKPEPFIGEKDVPVFSQPEPDQRAIPTKALFRQFAKTCWSIGKGDSCGGKNHFPLCFSYFLSNVAI